MVNRHTMGQDWGGRRKVNPENCPKITAKMVRQKADNLDLKIERGDFYPYSKDFLYSNRGPWWEVRENGWYLLGITNYIAMQTLNEIESYKYLKEI